MNGDEINTPLVIFQTRQDENVFVYNIDRFSIIHTICSSSFRDSRAIQHPYKYIPTSNTYINRRVDNLIPSGPGSKQNFFNGPSSSSNAPNQFFNNRIPQNGPDVSETDLYLLSAIEKLVYRVDYMERRLHKTEQLVYYLMAGNNDHKKEIYGKAKLNCSLRCIWQQQV